MLKKIKLYGELADRYGKYWELDVSSPAEAIRALCVNNEGMREFIGSSEERGVGYRILLEEYQIKEPCDISVNTTAEYIQIIPAIIGGKSSIGKIIIGAIIIYLAWPYMAATGATGMAANIAVNIGVALIMTGVSELLAPDPGDGADTRDGYSFSGPLNTTDQGIAVPVAYGQVLVGGATIGLGFITSNQ